MIDYNKLTLYEALKLINADTNLLDTVFKFQNNSPLHHLIKCAYLPDYKLDLPEGKPPYTPSHARVGMDSVDLLNAVRRGRLDYLTKAAKIRPEKKEEIFIRLLENINAQEAEVLIAIKDQTLDKMFKNLTYETWATADYLPSLPNKSTDIKSKPTTKRTRSKTQNN